MNLKGYFDEQQGLGVLSTADAEGRVNSAIYARPQILDDGRLALIMRKRLSHKNLQVNPYASYLFKANSAGYRGVRLALKKIGEDDNPELIQDMTRRCLSPDEDKAKGPKFIVYFEVEHTRELIGDVQPQ
jgi:hypothetical protein